MTSASARVRSIDVHVHLHPERLARAISEVFAREGWHQAHGWEPERVAESLAAHGVEHFCFFSYAHKPGIARALNAWAAETARRLPTAIPVGTVHAGDPDLVAIADEAMDDLGLAGFKFHLSVQRFRADDARLMPLYERVAERRRFLIVHAGTMPYRDAFTGLEGFRAVMERFPALRVIVAHLGAFDTESFLKLTEAFPNLHLDTTMALTPFATPYLGLDPATIPTELILRYQDRIMLGSDFPLIPYPYEEERRFVETRALPDAVARKILYENAARFLGLVRSSGR
ncbi:MAG TPA: amidohydrolase family protein [Methylomirabilota bacterium]|nr:amidohydrolase family protein [Methylomirabilota bacterium]